MTSILAIEDDPSIRAALERGLTERGHSVQTAATGISGLEAVLGERPDLVLLDLGLPDVDGLTVITMIRAASAVPIIVITAVDDDPTMVRALDSGADDYVVKPFRLDQVTARIRAVMRRTNGRPSPEPIRVGELVIHEPTRYGHPRGRAARAGPAGVRPAAGARRSAPGRSSASAPCSPMSGSRPTGAPTAPSTSTCRGYAASSARPRPSRATWRACAESAYAWWTRGGATRPATEAPDQSSPGSPAETEK